MRLLTLFILIQVLVPASALATPESDREQLSLAFNQWLNCQRAALEGNTPPECRCNQSPTAEPGVDQDFSRAFLQNCVPTDSDANLAFNPALQDSEVRARDQLICGCFERRQGFDAAVAPPPTAAQLTAETGYSETNGREWARVAIRRVSVQERIATSISAINFATTREEALALGGLYLTNRGKIDSTPSPELVQQVGSILEDSSLTTSNCLLFRDYLLANQFPTDASVYEDLSGQFNPDDWNYRTLQETLRVRFRDLEEAGRSVDGRRIMDRMKFLYANPAFKGLFMSNDMNSRTTKNELFQLLKRHFPRPDCPANSACTRGPQWSRQLDLFKPEITKFLARKELHDDIRTGMVRSSELSRQALEANAIYSRINTTSQNADVTPASRDAQAWGAFCEARRQRQSRPQSYAVNPWLIQLEESFGLDMSDQTTNPKFQAARRSYCEYPRKSRDLSRQMTFGTYRFEKCANLSIRVCLGKFTTEYPMDSNGSIEGELALTDILSKAPSFVLERGDTEKVFAISGNKELQQASFSSLANNSDLLDPKLSTGTFREQQASAQLQKPQGQSAAAPLPDTYFVPTLPAATTPAVAEEVQAAGRTALRSRDETQEIADEISSLRRTLTEEQSRNGSSPSSGRITELTASLRSLEDRLRQSEERYERDMQLYQQRLASAGGRPGQEREIDNEQPEERSRRPAGGTTSGGVAQVRETESEAQVAAAMNFQAQQGGASLGGRPTSVPRAVSASAINLQRYGVENVSLQGAVVVADPSRSVDIQQLQADAGSNVIEVPTTLAQFNALPAADKERYFQQARGLSGSVVKLTFNDGEAFIVKQGQDLTLVPAGPNSPLAGGSAERRYRLSEVVAELQNAN